MPFSCSFLGTHPFSWCSQCDRFLNIFSDISYASVEQIHAYSYSFLLQKCLKYYPLFLSCCDFFGVHSPFVHKTFSSLSTVWWAVLLLTIPWWILLFFSNSFILQAVLWWKVCICHLKCTRVFLHNQFLEIKSPDQNIHVSSIHVYYQSASQGFYQLPLWREECSDGFPHLSWLHRVI